MTRTALALAGISGLVVVFLTVLGGAALVTGTGVLAESGLRSRVAIERLTGADVVVSARQTVSQQEDLPVALPERARVPASLVTSLARLPGVAAAVGDVSFPASGSQGHGWSSVSLLSNPQVYGTPPRGPGEVALSQGRVGDQVKLVVAGQQGTYRVTALVSPSSGVYFADDVAARFAAGVDLVGLRSSTSPEELAARVLEQVGNRYVVSVGDARGDAEEPGAAAARPLLLLMASSIAGVTLLIVGFVVAGALSLSINRQRRDLALLRAAGATPRQVRRMVAAQGLVGAALAFVPGALLGYLLADRFGELLSGLGVLPARLPLSVSPLPGIVAALLLLGVVRVSAWGASLRVSQLPAVSAVAESVTEPRSPSMTRAWIGLGLIVSSLALSSVPLFVRSQAGAAGTALAGIVAVIGLALAGPWLVRSTTGLLAQLVLSRESLPDGILAAGKLSDGKSSGGGPSGGGPSGGGPSRGGQSDGGRSDGGRSDGGSSDRRRAGGGVSAAGWLAVANVHGYAARTAGAIAALGMVVTLTLSYALTQTTVMAAAERDVVDGTGAAVAVTAPSLGGVPKNLLSELRRTPGVTAATPVTATTVLIPGMEDGKRTVESTGAAVLGPDAASVVNLGLRAGKLTDLVGKTVAVDDQSAKVGERRRLILGDGTPVTARVVATYSRGLGFGPVVLSRDLAAGHTTSGLDHAVLVRLAAGATFTPPYAGIEVASAATAFGGGKTPPEVWVSLALLAVLLGYVLVSVANRLVATTAGRRAELETLQRIGATPFQLRTMLRGEAVLVALASVAGGVLLSVAPLALLGVGFLGRPWAAGPVWVLPAAALVVGLIAWLAHELPARHLLKHPL